MRQKDAFILAYIYTLHLVGASFTPSKGHSAAVKRLEKGGLVSHDKHKGTYTTTWDGIQACQAFAQHIRNIEAIKGAL